MTINKSQFFAHRAGSGLWPQNSRHAVTQFLNTIATQSQQGLELDIVLTKDHIPVLAHDPWVHKTLCTTTDGEPLSEVFICDKTLKELQHGFLCGGMKDEEFPEAEIISESIMSLEEVLQQLKALPQTALYLDLKIQPPLTLSASDYAEAIMSLWQTHQLSNHLIIEIPDNTSAKAFLPYKSDLVTLLISYPAFYAKQNWTWVGIKAVVKSWFYPSGARKNAMAAQVDGVATPLAAFNSKTKKQLKKEDLIAAVYTINSQEDMEKATSIGTDIIITDYPDQF